MTVANSGMTLYTNNDNDTGWTGEDSTSNEVFWQGSGAQKWIVSKTATETATLTLSANLSAAKYFTFGMLSTISPFYNTIKIQMKQDASNYEEFLLADRTAAALTYRAINGEYILGSPVLQFGQGTTTGTYNRASHATLDITVDNSTSGNIRSVENHYMDAMYYGNGRIIGGTTVGDKLFRESNDINISGDILDCCTMAIIGGKTVFAMTDLYVTTTLGNSYGESLEFKELPNTDNIYTLTITGTADFQDSSYSAGSSNVTVNLDTSGATSWQMLGGSVVGAGTTIFKASQVVDSAVFTDRSSLTHNGALFEKNTVNTSGVMTVSSTGTCTNNTYNKPSGISAILVADLAHAPVNTFISDGSCHAVELSTVGSGSMVWDGVTSGHDAGTASSPVIPANTGNEDIYVNVLSGTLTISVSSGATIPSIRSAGATVNVISGQVTLLVNVQDDATKLPIDLAQTSIQLLNSPYTQLMNKDTDVSGVASEQYSFVADTDVVVKSRKSEITDDPRYFADSQIAKITASGLIQTIALKVNDFLS